MVASDTVVGLVGAGILLVALVGVFVYESRAGGTGGDVIAEKFPVSSSGTATARAGTGTQLAGGQCLPQPPATQCQAASTAVELTVKGLPDANGAAYVAFLKGQSTVAVGALQKSGKDYATGQKTVNGQFTSLVVTLEPSGSATSPSGPQILSFDGISASGKDLKMNMEMPIVKLTSGQVKYVPAGGGFNTTATLSGVPSYSGMTYRGWMLKESPSGESYSFVGNFTGSAGNGSISGIVSGSSGDFKHFIVTLDPSGSFDKNMPKGAEVMITPEK